MFTVGTAGAVACTTIQAQSTQQFLAGTRQRSYAFYDHDSIPSAILTDSLPQWLLGTITSPLSENAGGSILRLMPRASFMSKMGDTFIEWSDSVDMASKTWVASRGYLTTFSETDPLSVYLSDSASMLSRYARKENYYDKVAADARFLQSYTETDPLSVHVADSANMLLPYLLNNSAASIYATITAVNARLQIADTAAMLNDYLRKSLAASTYATIAIVDGKVNVSDTANMLNRYLLSATASGLYATITALNGKVNISDTSSMLNRYLLSATASGLYATISNLALKVAIADTATMLANYFKTENFTGSFNTALATKTTDNLTQGSTNKYYSDALARNAISLTTSGSSGAATYSSSTGVLNIPNYTSSSGTVTSVAFSAPQFTVSGSPITSAGTLVLTFPKVVTAATYNTVTVDSIGRVTQGFSANPSAVTRPINSTSFQPSLTQSTRVSYSITHTLALSIVTVAGSSMIYLEISPNNSTWTTINAAGQSETLGVGVSVTKSTTSNVNGEVPAGYYCRLRSVVSGGASAAYAFGQETPY